MSTPSRDPEHQSSEPASIGECQESAESERPEPNFPSPASSAKTQYSVKYVGNSSKRWDGRVISLEGQWLETLYEPAELVPGKQVSLPWLKKGGAVQYWSAEVVDPASAVPAPAPAPAPAAARKGIA